MTKPYRHEWLVLGLIMLAAFSFFHGAGAQDRSRLALTQALYADGSLRIDRWIQDQVDFAVYDGHYYTDKAPGMSFLALPGYAVLRVVGVIDTEDERAGVWWNRGVLGIVRLLTGGVAFLAVVFLVGRTAEALAAGTGAASATAFGLGTLVSPLAAVVVGHVAAAALAFAAFVAAWSGLRAPERRLPLLALAGLSAGLAVLFEYQTALIALVLLAYVAARSLRGAVLFAAGLVPSALTLASYNTVAFGSPLHFSYRYVNEMFAQRQSTGFFGIGLPNTERLTTVLFSWKGLLVQTPVVALGAVGLVLLWRADARVEAAMCAVIGVLFLFVTAGYFDPMGGMSPGPRFFVPALPFLAVGLPLAFRRWPVVTLAVTVVSAAAMFYRNGDWSHEGWQEFDNVWGILLSNAVWAVTGTDEDLLLPLTIVGVIPIGLSVLAALGIGGASVLRMYGGPALRSLRSAGAVVRRGPA